MLLFIYLFVCVPIQRETDRSKYFSTLKCSLRTSESPTHFMFVSLVCEQKTKDGDCCVFPFQFSGEEYTSCTTEGYDVPWCALTSDYDEDEEWGECEGKLRKSQSEGGSVCWVQKLTFE